AVRDPHGGNMFGELFRRWQAVRQGRACRNDPILVKELRTGNMAGKIFAMPVPALRWQVPGPVQNRQAGGPEPLLQPGAGHDVLRCLHLIAPFRMARRFRWTDRSSLAPAGFVPEGTPD